VLFFGGEEGGSKKPEYLDAGITIEKSQALVVFLVWVLYFT